MHLRFAGVMAAGNARHRCTAIALAALIALVALGLAGCTQFVRLANDIRETGDRLRVVGGELASDASGTCTDCPFVVMVLADSAGRSLHNFRVFERPGRFQLAALNDSRALFAFHDLDRSFTYTPGEPAAWLDLPARLAERSVDDLRLRLRATVDRQPPQALPPLYELRGTALTQIDVRLAQVVPLADERFSPASADIGMWEPIGFMKSGRAGIFFLEPHDPARTPVLYVHGMGGSPRDFQALIDGLDRQRFQPWVLAYPSGLDLRASGDGLVGLLAELQLRLGFRRLHIVAHSVGGVLVRETLAECSRTRGCAWAGHFVSLSSPFGGVSVVGALVDFAAVVMPVWRNLAPQSEFLATLFDAPLPSPAHHHLVFGYRNAATLSRKSGDGVIALDSQLRAAAQQQATSLRGFDDDHASILTNPQVVRHVNRVLASEQAR